MPSADCSGLRDYMQWVPPPDPQKPVLPYRTNLVLSIRRHIPPDPFGTCYYPETWAREKIGRKEIYDIPQSELCLQNPPIKTPPHPDSTTPRGLRIIDEVACRDGRGAQLVRCRFEDDQNRDYVAKIYDPLYYSYQEVVPVDVTWSADSHYSCEAAAYEELAKNGATGVLVPNYFGSWTFDMPFLGTSRMRPVRMVLMEWVPCISMHNLMMTERFNQMTSGQRLDILAQILEVETKMLFCGVSHRDSAPRNLLLVGSDIDTQILTPRVYFIDFNISCVFSRPGCTHRMSKAPRPISPRYRFWRGYPDEFEGWVPQPWASQDKVFKGWLKTRWEQLGEFSGPTKTMEEIWDFDEAVEYVSPE